MTRRRLDCGSVRKGVMAKLIRERCADAPALPIYELLSWYCHGRPIPEQLRGRRRPRVTVQRDAFLESYEWRRMRMEVIKERGARCECCGATPADGRTVINVDHIQPRRLRPDLALDKSNLQVLCHDCNHGKGNWDQTDWRTEVSAPPEAYQPLWHRPEPPLGGTLPGPRLVKKAGR